MFVSSMPGRSGAVRVGWATPGTWTNCYLLEFPFDGYVVDILRGELSRLIFICSVSSDLPQLDNTNEGDELSLACITQEPRTTFLAQRDALRLQSNREKIQTTNAFLPPRYFACASAPFPFINGPASMMLPLNKSVFNSNF